MTKRHIAPYRLFSQQGVSLVELLISITIAVLVMAGVIQLFASSNETAYTSAALSRIQENARYAFRRIGDDIAKAGSYGCLNHSQAPDGLDDDNLTIADPDETPYINNNLNDIVFTLDTFAGGAAASADSWNDFERAFISGANGVGNAPDTLVLKYLDASNSTRVTGLVDVDTLSFNADANPYQANNIAFVGNCDRLVIATAAIPNNDQLTMTAHGFTAAHIATTFVQAYAGDSGAHRYFIGTSAAGTQAGINCANTDAQRQFCSLFRETNGDIDRELLQGVHDMQISYAIGNQSTTDLSTETDASARAYMENIDRVQVTLAFNAPEAAGGSLTRTITRIFAVRNQR